MVNERSVKVHLDEWADNANRLYSQALGKLGKGHVSEAKQLIDDALKLSRDLVLPDYIPGFYN